MSKEPNLINIQAVCEEIVRARTKFPKNDVLLAALMEEVGELANALLELRYAALRSESNRTTEIRSWLQAVRKEAVQVAAVAVRILEEGCSEFPQYAPLPPPARGLHLTAAPADKPYERGRDIYVRCEEVLLVEPSHDNASDTQRFCSVLTLRGGTTIRVKESPEYVLKLMREA